MELIEKIEPLIIFLAIIIGLIFSNFKVVSNNTDYLINIFLCLMLYGVFLEIPLIELKNKQRDRKSVV